MVQGESELEQLNWELCEAWLLDAENNLTECVKQLEVASGNLKELRKEVELQEKIGDTVHYILEDEF